MKTLAALAALALFAGIASADQRCQGYQDGSPRAKQPGGYLNSGCPHYVNDSGKIIQIDPHNLNSPRFWKQAPNNQVGADASHSTAK